MPISRPSMTTPFRLPIFLCKATIASRTGLIALILLTALLTRMVAAQAGYEPGELIWTGGDTHLYLNHRELVEEQLRREPEGEPRLELLRKPDTIFDYAFEDFVVTDYVPQGRLSAPVAV